MSNDVICVSNPIYYNYYKCYLHLKGIDATRGLQLHLEGLQVADAGERHQGRGRGRCVPRRARLPQLAIPQG